ADSFYILSYHHFFVKNFFDLFFFVLLKLFLLSPDDILLYYQLIYFFASTFFFLFVFFPYMSVFKLSSHLSKRLYYFTLFSPLCQVLLFVRVLFVFIKYLF